MTLYEFKVIDARVGKDLVQKLWALGHCAELDGTFVRSDAPQDVVRAALSARKVDDSSEEAREPATARAASLANPRWWGCEDQESLDPSWGGTAGRLFWRYENEYVCHVVLVFPPPGCLDKVVWSVCRDDGRYGRSPDEVNLDEAIAFDTVTGSDPDMLTAIAQDRCHAAARDRVFPVTIKLPEVTCAWLRAEALARDVTADEIIRQLIESHAHKGTGS